MIEREWITCLLSNIEKELPAYMGKRFEKVCIEFLWTNKIFEFTKIGRWWGVNKNKESNVREPLEIDIVALNENTKEICFAECKWQEKKVKKHIASELLEKAGYVDWNIKKRKEYFIIFSKSGFEKSCLEFCKQRGILLFDLKDIEKIFKGRY